MLPWLQIAGGSGLTPMLQVAQEITRNPEDKTEVTLVYANVSEDDILLKRELDDMARKHKNFKVCWHPISPAHQMPVAVCLLPQPCL